MEPNKHKHHHHILPNKTAVAVGVALLILTWFTVWIAGVDLGRFNFLVAMLVASVKAGLVSLIFMNLLYDRKENAVIFYTSFLFLAIFIVFTGTDLFFRGDVYVKKGQTFGVAAKSKFKKAWNPTPELTAHGRDLFTAQCVSCHGANGKGDGPAAGALVPAPRNFTATAGWKNGHKPSQIFKTLKEGIPGSAMASYSTLPQDDRWALSHYVASLNPSPQKDASEDFAKIGLDPNKEETSATAEEAPSIPVALAMKRMSEADVKLSPSGAGVLVNRNAPGARVYEAHCLSCHGAQGQGGIQVAPLGGAPKGRAITSPLSGSAIASQDQFNQVVVRGLSGDLMPGFGHLTTLELRDLYQFVRSLPAAAR